MLNKKTLLLIIIVFSFLGILSKVSAQNPSGCNGDYNLSTTVDINDFLVFAQNYKKTTIQCSLDIIGDDCYLNLQDFSAFASVYKVANACPSTNPPPPPVPSSGIWISPEEILSIPIAGQTGCSTGSQCASAWNNLVSNANSSWGSANLADNNSNHDVYTLAGAIVSVRLNDNNLRNKTIGGIQSAMSSDFLRTLELARGLQTYVIAADIIGYRTTEFENWLIATLKDTSIDGRDGGGLYNNSLTDSTNWGGHERASVVSSILYLGPKASSNGLEINELVRAYKEFIGENVSPKTLIYRGTNWIADQNNKAGVNRLGAIINGQNVSGVIPEDWRRGEEFKWPPTQSGYMWEGVQGFVVTAVMLHRSGHVPFTSGNNVLVRVLHQLMDPVNPPNPGINYPPGSDDAWIPYLVNRFGASNFSTGLSSPGKNMGYTDWTHR